MILTMKIGSLFCLTAMLLPFATAFGQQTNYYQPTNYTTQPAAASPIQDTASAEPVPGVVGSISDTACDSSGCDSGGCGVGGYGSACDGGCDSGCTSCIGSLGGGYFGRFLKRSDHGFSDFISPMTNPVFFEDPRNLTEARLIFLNHQVPQAAGNGDVRLFALQIRARLSENVSFIATKDGYIDSTNPLITDGWADVSAGLKFNLRRNAAEGSMLSAGFTYEMPNGSASALQGNGDGELNLFLTGGKRLGCRSHWLGAGGWRIPVDGDAESESMYFSNHLDYQVTNRFYVLTEANWYHWTGSGTGGIPGVEGLDLFNFGSTGVTGNDIVTAAFGAKFKNSKHSEIGLAWEIPLTQRQDVLEDRLAFDWIFRY